ncbi:hypothetical protein J2T22_004258 [Pseudarthrobacter defluvii]|uniref:Secreted protein n=1 Tax=Pseudarthrobacter defluvii TaxID=410837 RepID=A0ABT9UQX9_9MICC|nr:hypothetical protein [Pseudarthrobacter defluvii]
MMLPHLALARVFQRAESAVVTFSSSQSTERTSLKFGIGKNEMGGTWLSTGSRISVTMASNIWSKLFFCIFIQISRSPHSAA